MLAVCDSKLDIAFFIFPKSVECFSPVAIFASVSASVNAVVQSLLSPFVASFPARAVPNPSIAPIGCWSATSRFARAVWSVVVILYPVSEVMTATPEKGGVGV